MIKPIYLTRAAACLWLVKLAAFQNGLQCIVIIVILVFTQEFTIRIVPKEVTPTREIEQTDTPLETREEPEILASPTLPPCQKKRPTLTMEPLASSQLFAEMSFADSNENSVSEESLLEVEQEFVEQEFVEHVEQ